MEHKREKEVFFFKQMLQLVGGKERVGKGIIFYFVPTNYKKKKKITSFKGSYKIQRQK